MKISTIWYVADFETTSYSYYKENGYTKVWLWAICDSNADITAYGEDIDTFIKFIRKLYGKTIYFHNLKFDGEFIIYYLEKMGIHYTPDLKNVNQGYTILMGEMGEFYSLDIKFTRNKIVHINDSLKLLPFKVEKIAKDFNLPILKGKIDYNKYEVNDESLEYIFHDVKIIAMALKQIKDEGMTKMTTASCAYNMYISGLSEDYINNCFPTLDDAWLSEWREAYRGGRSQVNPYYQGKILENVKRFDINSMYPSIMYKEKLPYGNPIEIDTINSYKFELYHVNISFSLKEGHLPTLLKKGSVYGGRDSYYVDTDGVEEIWISNIDYKLLLRHYDIKFIVFIKMYGFATSSLMFFEYVNKWYSKKSIDTGAKKVVDKLMLNCLYGKFGSNHIGIGRGVIIDEELDVVKYPKGLPQPMKHYYLPLAIAITSYAHLYIDDAIMITGIENFVYCDTDSVHTLGTLPDDMIDNHILGKFKLEGIEDKSKYVRQKTYIIKEKDEITITCAGMTQDMKNTAIKVYGDLLFDIFDVGYEMNGKLMPKHVPGGIVLYETTFKIT